MRLHDSLTFPFLLILQEPAQMAPPPRSFPWYLSLSNGLLSLIWAIVVQSAITGSTFSLDCLFTYLSLISELLSSKGCVIDDFCPQSPAWCGDWDRCWGGCVQLEVVLGLPRSKCGGFSQTPGPPHSPRSSHTGLLLGPWTHLACICLYTSFSLCWKLPSGVPMAGSFVFLRSQPSWPSQICLSQHLRSRRSSSLPSSPANTSPHLASQ